MRHFLVCARCVELSQKDLAEQAENAPPFLAGNLLPKGSQRQAGLGGIRVRGGATGSSYLDTLHLLVCLADIGESTSPG